MNAREREPSLQGLQATLSKSLRILLSMLSLTRLDRASGAAETAPKTLAASDRRSERWSAKRGMSSGFPVDLYGVIASGLGPLNRTHGLVSAKRNSASMGCLHLTSSPIFSSYAEYSPRGTAEQQ